MEVDGYGLSFRIGLRGDYAVNVGGLHDDELLAGAAVHSHRAELQSTIAAHAGGEFDRRFRLGGPVGRFDRRLDGLVVLIGADATGRDGRDRIAQCLRNRFIGTHRFYRQFRRGIDGGVADDGRCASRESSAHDRPDHLLELNVVIRMNRDDTRLVVGDDLENAIDVAEPRSELLLT